MNRKRVIEAEVGKRENEDKQGSIEKAIDSVKSDRAITAQLQNVAEYESHETPVMQFTACKEK